MSNLKTEQIKPAVLLVWLFVFVPLVFAQQKPEAATPQDKGDVVRVTTELVQTGITVVDKSGEPVTGLPREAFALYVDDEPQPILFFDTLTTGSVREAAYKPTDRGSSPASAETRTEQPN